MLPVIEGPGDVPELRQWLLNRSRPGGALRQLDGRFIHETMTAAQLWWVEEETCHLLAESAPTWPADAPPLDFDTIPVKAGFAVFAHDMIGTDTFHGDEEVRVSAICWGPVRLPPLPKDPRDDAYGVVGPGRIGLGIGMFSRMSLHKGLDQADLLRTAPVFGLLLNEMFVDADDSKHGPMVTFTDATGEGELRDKDQIESVRFARQGDLYAYLGRTDWMQGMGVEEMVADAPIRGEFQARSMAEDRRLLAALWAITQTPVVTTVRTKPPRHIARRSTRKGLDPEVRILRLGGPRRENIVTGTSDREWKHSWIVGPHFRWQACGPGWKERKLILVGPYTKGPSDKPLLGGERVWRVVPPRPS